VLIEGALSLQKLVCDEMTVEEMGLTQPNSGCLQRTQFAKGRDCRKQSLGINVAPQELPTYGRWAVLVGSAPVDHGSSERYAHMENCEICKVITKLGLPRAVHDLWFCTDKQLPPRAKLCRSRHHASALRRRLPEARS
jgi:hypothetical protein